MKYQDEKHCTYCYSFFKSNGPTLSPVALLCLTWLPSHKGKVPDLQHLQEKKQQNSILGLLQKGGLGFSAIPCPKRMEQRNCRNFVRENSLPEQGGFHPPPLTSHIPLPNYREQRKLAGTPYLDTKKQKKTRAYHQTILKECIYMLFILGTLYLRKYFSCFWSGPYLRFYFCIKDVTKLYGHIGNQDRQTKEFEETDLSLHILFTVAQNITCDESKVLLREEKAK